MKTIFILCPSISGLGGVERVVISLANELCRDNRVIIGTLYKPVPEYTIENKVECICFRDCRYIRIGLISHILRKLVNSGKIQLNKEMNEEIYYPRYRVDAFYEHILKYNADDIIGVGIDMTIIASYIKQADKKTRVIGWQHNEYRLYFENPGEYYYGLIDLFNSRAEYIDYNIVLTNREKEIFDRKSLVKTKSIYNPLCIESDVNYDAVRWKEKNILFVGRISKQQKGIDMLVDILRCIFISGKMNDWTATIVGEGPDLEYLKNEIKRCNLGKYVAIAGGVNDVSSYYKKSSILVSTSRWEGFGLVITEAMFYGLCVVAFDNEGPAEIIKDGFDGLLIPKYNTILFVEQLTKLMRDEELRKKISSNSRNSAKKFSPGKIYSEWNEII